MLANIFLATAILEVIGTVIETVTVFSIFFSLWKEWTIEFKVLSPTLHLLFSCAQLWGARVFWLMSQQHRRAVDGSVVEVAAPYAIAPAYQQELVLGKEEPCKDHKNGEQMV